MRRTIGSRLEVKSERQQSVAFAEPVLKYYLQGLKLFETQFARQDGLAVPIHAHLVERRAYAACRFNLRLVGP